MKKQIINGKIEFDLDDIYNTFLEAKKLHPNWYDFLKNPTEEEVEDWEGGMNESYYLIYNQSTEDLISALSWEKEDLEQLIQSGYTLVLGSYLLPIYDDFTGDYKTHFCPSLLRSNSKNGVCVLPTSPIIPCRIIGEVTKHKSGMEAIVIPVGDENQEKILTLDFMYDILTLFHKNFNTNHCDMALYSNNELSELILCKKDIDDSLREMLLSEGYKEYITPEENVLSEPFVNGEPITKEKISFAYKNCIEYSYLTKDNLFDDFSSNFTVCELGEEYEEASFIKGYKILKYPYQRLRKEDYSKLIKQSIEYNQLSLDYIQENKICFALYVNKTKTDICIIPNMCRHFVDVTTYTSSTGWLYYINQVLSNLGWDYSRVFLPSFPYESSLMSLNTLYKVFKLIKIEDYETISNQYGYDVVKKDEEFGDNEYPRWKELIGKKLNKNYINKLYTNK